MFVAWMHSCVNTQQLRECTGTLPATSVVAGPGVLRLSAAPRETELTEVVEQTGEYCLWHDWANKGVRRSGCIGWQPELMEVVEQTGCGDEKLTLRQCIGAAEAC